MFVAALINLYGYIFKSLSTYFSSMPRCVLL